MDDLTTLVGAVLTAIPITEDQIFRSVLREVCVEMGTPTTDAEHHAVYNRCEELFRDTIRQQQRLLENFQALRQLDVLRRMLPTDTEQTEPS